MFGQINLESGFDKVRDLFPTGHIGMLNVHSIGSLSVILLVVLSASIDNVAHSLFEVLSPGCRLPSRSLISLSFLLFHWPLFFSTLYRLPVSLPHLGWPPLPRNTHSVSGCIFIGQWPPRFLFSYCDLINYLQIYTLITKMTSTLGYLVDLTPAVCSKLNLWFPHPLPMVSTFLPLPLFSLLLRLNTYESFLSPLIL